MMVVVVCLLGRAVPLDHPVEGMGAAQLVDIPVPLDMGSTIPQGVVAGYSGKVPVDTRGFARKVVDIQRCSRDIEMKRSPCQFLLDLWRLFDQ